MGTGGVCLKLVCKGGKFMSDHPNRNAKVKHYLLSTVDKLFNDGVGKSKHVIYQLNYVIEKKRTSSAIHSYSTKTTYKRVVAKFADFLKQEYNLKYERDFKKLTTDQLYNYVDRYFEKQKEQKLSKKTLQKHVSALYKVLSAIDKNISKYFDADNRAKWTDGMEKQDCDRYNNPQKIIENLKKINETAHAVAELQRLVGCRVGDVKKIEIDEKRERVVIKKSKGGRDRTIYFDYFKDDFERVKEYKKILDRALQEKSFSQIRKEEYYKALKEACRRSHEIYHGSHAFRYEAAQRWYEVISKLKQEEQEAYYRRILEDRGVSDENIEKAMEYVREKDAVAEAIISEELGHSRLDISREYLKLKGK